MLAPSVGNTYAFHQPHRAAPATRETPMSDQQEVSSQAAMSAPPIQLTQHGDNERMAQLFASLAAAQGEFDPIVKNRQVRIQMKQGGAYNFRYADLEEITAKTRPALSKHGLATIQIINPSKVARQGFSGLSLFTRLVHKSGAELVSEIEIPGYGGDIKVLGAGISYLRRYAKSSLLDVAADDDLDENGQEAGGGQVQQYQQPAQQQYQQPEQHDTREEPPAQGASGYSDDDFKKNLPAWTKAITTGKSTAERVIKMASTKGKLSAKQIKAIEAIAVPQKQETA